MILKINKDLKAKKSEEEYSYFPVDGFANSDGKSVQTREKLLWTCERI